MIICLFLRLFAIFLAELVALQIGNTVDLAGLMLVLHFFRLFLLQVLVSNHVMQDIQRMEIQIRYVSNAMLLVLNVLIMQE